MIVVLAGGVGAARFLEGVVRVVPPETVTAIVNTGDDFVLHGLHISPDLDIVTCTLADVIDRQQGWGIANDSYACLEWLGRLGGPTWFNLGDRDLALHIRRTELLRAGHTLSQAADELRRALGVEVHIVPMSDQPVPTHIITPAGEIHFEEYFVRRRAADAVQGVRFVGAETAQPAPGVFELLRQAETVLIAPSNPVVSIGPILALPGVRAALRETTAPVVAVSPIVGGAPIKGPAAPLMRALDVEVSAWGVAQMYRDILDVLIIDQQDSDLKERIESPDIQVVVTNTVMRGMKEKTQLAQVALRAARAISEV
jgi:LPPG:FO 2-phospho-L-lactate transferase